VGLPLEGIRILELGQIIAGCFGTVPMADLGAEVIKVEPFKGDAGRMPSVGYLRGESALFLTFNRNKQSLVLDLKRPEGLEVFYDLVRRSDVVPGRSSHGAGPGDLALDKTPELTYEGVPHARGLRLRWPQVPAGGSARP